jgi:DNA polymerase
MPATRIRSNPYETARPYLPHDRTLSALRAAAHTCHGCDLWREATQVVFGEGVAGARIVLVGEQPGDAEDEAGRPFVGPAGKLLDDALEAAGIARGDAYVTNAVKHFKFTRRGKKRIHDKPTRYEQAACRPWLEAELEALAPPVVVLLGATAAQSLLGAKFKVTEARGQVLETPLAKFTIATVHPASVLRAPDHDARAAARASFFADLAVAGECLRRL